jgi:hypothetical protein
MMNMMRYHLLLLLLLLLLLVSYDLFLVFSPPSRVGRPIEIVRIVLLHRVIRENKEISRLRVNKL